MGTDKEPIGIEEGKYSTLFSQVASSAKFRTLLTLCCGIFRMMKLMT
jgi:hypothetical protein